MKEKEIDKKLQALNVAIVSHTRTDGLSQVLEEWLRKRTKKLIFIGHPLYPTRNSNSEMKIYKDGVMKNVHKSPFLFKSGILLYFKDAFFTAFFIFKSGSRIDIAIGVDNLNTSVLLVLKKIKFIKKVVYHTVDYTPNRFSNKALNNIYHALDKWCCYRADIIWNSSSRMNEGRMKNGMLKNKIAKTIITPDGSNFDPKKRLKISQINRKLIAFVGHLRERLGLELLIKSFVQVTAETRDARLLIIGDGPLLSTLKKLANDLKISKHVIFTGFIKNHSDVDTRLRKAAVGIAMFEPVRDSYEYYSDAGKPKVYLAAGMPVVITAVPEIANEIHAKRAGIVIDYNEKELSNAIIKLIGDNRVYSNYRSNAIELSKKYIWENIFEKAFNETLKYFYE